MTRPLPVMLSRLLLNTLRVRFSDCGIPRQKAIIALWHEHLPVCIRVFRNRGFAVLISKSRDGELAAGLCGGWDYQVYRGSSSNGGSSGTKNLARRLQDPDYPGLGGMALDGPRGPYHSIQPGTQWLSEATGIPIYTAAVKVEPCVRLNNWDRTVIPVPFARTYIKICGPFLLQSSKELCLAMETGERELRQWITGGKKELS